MTPRHACASVVSLNSRYPPAMALFNLADAADRLPHAWKSAILARSGDCNIKILKMDRQPYPDETHDYNEALIVVSGMLRLSVAGETIEVKAGDMYVAQAGVPMRCWRAAMGC